METIQLKVEGMTCANCALTINKYLEKKGMQNIKVNPIDGDVSFEIVEGTDQEPLINGINDLGYEVVAHGLKQIEKKRFLSTQVGRFFVCLPFTYSKILYADRCVFEKWRQSFYRFEEFFSASSPVEPCKPALSFS